MIEFLNQYGQIWAQYFGMAILQNTLFLGIVFLILYWLRDANASMRYTIAMIGIIKLLLPPFLPASLLSKWFSFPGATIDIQVGKPMIAAAAESIEPTLSVSLIGFLLLVWFLTLAVSLFVPVLTTLRLKVKLRDARPIRFDEIDDGRVKILQSEKISMPLTVGFFSNKIFVPAQWNSWSPDCQKLILHHELAHIKRKDGIFKILQMVAQAIYFFHPLVWILNSRINQYREMACDDASVATKRNSSMEYSRYLVKIAEEMTFAELGCSSASALIRQRNELLNRVQYQIMEVAMKHISKKKLGVILTILLLSFGLLSFTFSNSPPPDEPGFYAFQKTGKVYGNITDKETGKAIKGAKIGIEGTTLWAASDDEGNYFIVNVPPGVYNLEARKDAYKNVIFSKVKVKEALSTKINFKLEPVMMKISETGEDTPPPPPPSIDKKEIWVDYDNPPEVVGGFKEVAKVLKYPESARKSGVTGFVDVTLQIDEDGKIVDSKIKKSLQPDCDKAALEALKAVKWKPALKKGKPVKVWITVPVKFALK